MNRFRDACLRELQFIRGSAVACLALFVLPAASLLLMAAMLSQGALRALPIGVVDEAHSPASRAVLEAVVAQPELRVDSAYASVAEAHAALRDGRIWAYIAIPHGFVPVMRGGEETLLIRSNAAYLSIGSVLERALERSVSGAVRAVWKDAEGLQGLGRQAMPQVQVSVLFNPQASFEWFLQALVQPAILHLFAACLGAYAMSRVLGGIDGRAFARWRRESGGGWVALAAKFTPYLLVMGAWGAAWLIWLVGVRGWRVQGSLAMIWLGQWMLFAASMALSGVLVALVRKPAFAFSATALYAGSALAYSGGSLPIDGAPSWVRVWSQSLPFTHYLTLQMDQFLGAPVARSVGGLCLLLAYAAVAFAGCVWLVRRDRAS